MFAAPTDLDAETVALALDALWSVPHVRLEYLPVGFGGHHWLATPPDGPRLFVTADDLRDRLRDESDTLDSCFQRLRAAYSTAGALADAGLEFVVAPTRTSDGAVTHRVADAYSLVVQPYLDDASTTGDDRRRDGDVRAILELLARMHATPVPHPPRDTFAVPNPRQLLEDLPWHDGPYAARARALVDEQRQDVTVLVGYYETLAARLASRPERLVATHGEPHGDNVLRTAGGLVLVDWDTTLLAPPERDLWMLADAFPGVPELYAEVSGSEVDVDAVAFYRLWFDLDEIGRYSRLFRARHDDDANTAVAWGGLQERLRTRERWPQVFG